MGFLLSSIMGVVFFVSIASISMAQSETQSPAMVLTKADGRIQVGPNPNNVTDLFQLILEPQTKHGINLSDNQVQAAIELGNKARETIKKMAGGGGLSQSQMREILAAQTALHQAAIDEILTPMQLERLKQIVYRREIASMGWADAITTGRLSEAIGIVEGQKSSLSARAKKIVDQMDAQILAAKNQAEQLILAELSTEQREKAKQTLGEFYNYLLVTNAQHIYMQAKQKQEEKQRKNR